MNLFFENSTRTRASFEIAAARLGADVVNMDVATSSVKKGESLLDTAYTLEAMRPDFIVVRHGQAGAPLLLARKVTSSILNAGDGQHEHPTQALLDALTLAAAFWRSQRTYHRHLRGYRAFPRGAIQSASADHHGGAGALCRAAHTGAQRF